MRRRGDSPGDRRWPSWRPRCGRRLRGEKAPSHSRGEACTRSNKSLSGHLRSRLTEASLIFPVFLRLPLPPTILSLFLPSKIHGDNRGTRIIIVILLVSSPRLINPPPRFDRRYDDTFSFSAITVETLIILVEKGNKYCGEIGFLANTYFSSVYARYDREGLSVSCIHLRLNVKCNSRGED